MNSVVEKSVGEIEGLKEKVGEEEGFEVGI